jgi:transcriptional regulator with XRE-family HTH domain
VRVDVEKVSATDLALAENLRHARERAGLHQRVLAERMRDRGRATFTQQTVTRIENGQRAVRLGEARDWADITGTSVTTLLQPPELAREGWLIRDAIRVLLDTRDQIRALRLRQSNARLQLERRVQSARNDGTTAGLADAIASAEHVLKQEDQ